MVTRSQYLNKASGCRQGARPAERVARRQLIRKQNDAPAHLRARSMVLPIGEMTSEPHDLTPKARRTLLHNVSPGWANDSLFCTY